ncbi:MAG: P-loop NTPase fold protein [Armatimonadota bacterium]
MYAPPETSVRWMYITNPELTGLTEGRRCELPVKEIIGNAPISNRELVYLASFDSDRATELRLCGWGYIELPPTEEAQEQVKSVATINCERLFSETLPQTISRVPRSISFDAKTVRKTVTLAAHMLLSLDIDIIQQIESALRNEKVTPPTDLPPTDAAEPKVKSATNQEQPENDLFDQLDMTATTKYIIESAKSLRSGEMTSRALIFGMFQVYQKEYNSPNAAIFLGQYLGAGDVIQGSKAAYVAASTASGRRSRVSEECLQLLGDALKIAQTINGNSELAARHLLAAVLTQPDASSCDACTLLTEMSMDVKRIRASFVLLMQRTRPPSEAAAWQQLFSGKFDDPPVIPPYHTDCCNGPDCLGITRDVNAMASLIVSRSLIPPLSIGLFGNWGSGKSFFMDKLSASIDHLAKQTKTPGKYQQHYWENVVQIKFNAWNYIDANLWASLVSHIFEGLNAYWEHPDSKLGDAKKKAYTNMKIAQEAVNAANEQIKIADKQREDIKKTIDGLQEQCNINTQELAKALATDIEKLVSNKIDDAKKEKEFSEQFTAAEQSLKELSGASIEAGKSIQEVYQQINELWSTTGQTKAMWSLLARGKNARVALWIAGVASAVTLISMILFALYKPELSTVANVAIPFIGAVSAAAKWISDNAKQLSKAMEPLQQVYVRLTSAFKAAEKEKAEAIANAEKQLQEAQQAHQTAQSSLEEAQRMADAAKSELADVESGKFMMNFIKQRMVSEDYRRHLGLISIIQDDLNYLSCVITEYNQELLGQRGKSASKQPPINLGINRIVLYIDDLDRCPPKRVVEVLQAIHLLLAFPLFVVVVGVDARWVAMSLKKQYPDMLVPRKSVSAIRSERTMGLFTVACPEDYLEKIFQIPYWLKPMDPHGVQTIMLDLVSADRRKNAAQSTTRPATGTGGGMPEDARPPEGDGTPEGARPPEGDGTPEGARPPEGDGTPEGARPPEGDGTPDDARPPEDEIEPQQLLLSDIEIRAMQELAVIVGRSPRETKRFLNIYRLLRAALQPHERDAFVGTEDDLGLFPSPMLLLALAIGVPATSTTLFQRLRHETQTYARFNDIFQSMVGMRITDQEEMARLHMLQQQGGFIQWSTLPVTALKPWIDRVCQFSFEAASVLEQQPTENELLTF